MTRYDKREFFSEVIVVRRLLITDGDAVTVSLSKEQQRVSEVLESLFGGSETEMAERIGVSQSTVSRIVNGQRNPGPKVLRAIATLPGVSPDWVLRGKGEPPRIDALRDPGRCQLPLVSNLELVCRKLTESLWQGPWYLVSPEHYSETRVLFRVPRDGDCVRRSAGRLKPGDRVVFETNRDLWISNRKFVDEKVCVIRTPDDPTQRRAELVRVKLKGGKSPRSGGTLLIRRFQMVNTIPKQISEQKLVGAIARLRVVAAMAHERESRYIRFSGDRIAQRVSVEPLTRREKETIEPESILAVAITVIGRP
jgi:transcriptional regulator with XRE-family HTH domain